MAESRHSAPPGRYYTPRPITRVPGVKKEECPSFDLYSGTADALIASGLTTPEMLPGQPGMPGTSVSYRPLGAGRRLDARGSLESWWWVPGYMRIVRQPDRIQVRLTISREEQRRREAAQRQRDEARRNALSRQQDGLDVAVGFVSASAEQIGYMAAHLIVTIGADVAAQLGRELLAATALPARGSRPPSAPVSRARGHLRLVQSTSRQLQGASGL